LKDAEIPSEPAIPTSYFVRVMLPSGYNGDTSKTLQAQLKFLVAKLERNDLMCVGGAWSPTKDGGDPATEESGLIRAAM
jgi:hypothetical protein